MYTAWGQRFTSPASCAAAKRAQRSLDRLRGVRQNGRAPFPYLFDEMEKRWPSESVRLVHRVGTVRVNEPSFWVEVIAPHEASFRRVPVAH